MSPARARAPAALLALMLLTASAAAQGTGTPSVVDIMRQQQLKRSSPDSTAHPVVRAAPPPATLGLPVRPLRIPGVTAALGDSTHAVLARLGVAATAAGADGGRTYTATVTFFGAPAAARLQFVDGRLAQAEFDVQSPTPPWSRYVMDELRRQGYRRQCRTLDERQSDCTWDGRTEVWLQADGTRLSARVGVPPGLRMPEAVTAGAPDDTPDAAAAPAAAHSPAPPVATLPETLRTDRATALGHEAATILKAATPTFPAAARTAGVQGIVHVIALVDEHGVVVSASVLNSIPELDAAAIETAMRYQFAPLREDGRPVRFQVDIPVRFLLH